MSASEARASCPITRTHQRFLLRNLEFSQQYAPMYRCRVESQLPHALRAVQDLAQRDPGEATLTSLEPKRLLELQVGQPTICVGVVYKQMKLLPRFLDEYQRELVRIDAGDEDNDDDGGGVVEEEISAVPGEEEEGSNTQAAAAAVDEHYSVCNDADELTLEDSSGRVILLGVKAEYFCTGVVLGVFGTLQPNGSIHVHRYAFGGAVRTSLVPRPLSPGASAPCYVAIVCGLTVNRLRPDAPAEEVAAQAQAQATLSMLVHFLCGNVSDAAMLAKSRAISRLIIGGNSIAPTEELKLKRKVKLDPSDHVRMNDDKALSGVITSAALMRELDGLLERVAASVETELMPGDNDMSDAFQPQQPLHPVLLPRSSRHSTLRLVTNPFTFVTGASPTAKDEDDAEVEKKKKAKLESSPAGTRFFITAGQNVNDVARETRFPSRLDAMKMIVSSGCACPTAPNTLFSYPFCKSDPFLFQEGTPHCFIACDQPQYETDYATAEELDTAMQRYYPDSARSPSFAAPGQNEEEEAKETRREKAAGVRFISVPSFARTGALVLVDVSSPDLHTSMIDFSVC